MKHMVFGVLSGGIVILFVVMLLTMQHKNVRKEELEQSLTEAMETTLQIHMLRLPCCKVCCQRSQQLH